MNKENDYRYVQVRPHKRQVAHQQMEMYAFFHFSVNTYTDHEWGDGMESPEIFNPTRLDASQWIAAIKCAGMTGAILTCKHHDGFCLWPSKYTEHSVKNSPYRNGQGDVVKEVADACHAAGLKFGIYLSPWDMNNPSYGKGKEYDDFYIAQLTELLTGYGDIFAIWLDGACGEDADGRQQTYDWDRYYETMRRLQPDANICVCGPDVRWCGNESGTVRPSEWSVVPAALADCERIKEQSQHSDNESFRQRKIQSSDLDLGSREKLEAAGELIWYPAEINTSIRPGWFYHEAEDNEVKTAEELLELYYGSVGGNATLLLNIPPTPEGLLHEKDVRVLEDFGKSLGKAFETDYAEAGIVTRIGGSEDYTEICVKLPQKQKISMAVLQEDVWLSQRIESFEILASVDGTLTKLYEGTTVGYKKIARFGITETDEVIVRITDSRLEPVLSHIGLY